jgi:hypothetical protein
VILKDKQDWEARSTPYFDELWLASDELSEALDNRWNSPTYLMSSRLYRMQNKLRPIRPKPIKPTFVVI